MHCINKEQQARPPRPLSHQRHVSEILGLYPSPTNTTAATGVACTLESSMHGPASFHRVTRLFASTPLYSSYLSQLHAPRPRGSSEPSMDLSPSPPVARRPSVNDTSTSRATKIEYPFYSCY